MFGAPVSSMFASFAREGTVIQVSSPKSMAQSTEQSMESREVWKRAEFVTRLMGEFGYSESDVVHTVRRLLAVDCDPLLQDQVTSWFLDGVLPSDEIAGHSVASLMASGRAASPVAAMFTMEWLRRDPKHALASLARPTDWAVPRD